MNHAHFIGRIGRDAATRQAGNSDATSWPIAVDVGYGDNKTTLWIDCTLWGERGGKLAQYIRKGERIGVHGEVSLREYQKDGETKTTLALRVADVTLLGDKSAGESKPAGGGRPASREPRQTPRSQAPQQADDFESDSIPF
jgi:single-strand DNA-binding protein